MNTLTMADLKKFIEDKQLTDDMLVECESSKEVLGYSCVALDYTRSPKTGKPVSLIPVFDDTK